MHWKNIYFLLAILCAAIIFVSATDTSAIPWHEQDPAIKPGIPDYTPSQKSIDKGVICAEVAAANVTSYWDSHGLPNLVPDGTTPDQLMQNLINYDVRSDPGEGLKKYFKEKGYAGQIIIANVDPTWDNVIGELKKSEMLILGFTWGLFQAHVVTIAGWDLTDPDGNPLKQLGFHDPNNPLNKDLRGDPPLSDYTYSKDGTDFYKVSVDKEGHFTFKYQRDNEVNVNRLTSVSVPEPCTLLLFGSGLAGLVGLAKRRLFKKS